MPLLGIWKSNPKEIDQLTIEQIVTMAGDGKLRDASACSHELREYLTQANSQKLSAYIEHCLTDGFNKSGLILQDVINELGRRLEYDVTNGLYQGTSTTVGWDGLWKSPEGHTIIAEVKTTDAYRISLDKLAEYRQKLLAEKKLSEPSSILIVVGRNDTGELEAQIRGSRHAWDVRLISTGALRKLVFLKENSDLPETGRQIRGILTPMEYTRLDNMIEVMFATATDVETVIAETNQSSTEPPQPKDEASGGSGWQFTDFAVLDAKRAEIVDAVAKKIGTKLIKKSRALFWDAEHKKRVGCTISKRYTQVTEVVPLPDTAG
jgi:hypothetical protein